MRHLTAPPPQVRPEPIKSHRQKQLERWNLLLSDLAHPAVELEVENASILVATFAALHRAGHQFDHAIIVVMTKLKQQLQDQRNDETIEDWNDPDHDCGGSGESENTNRFMPVGSGARS